jgi:hypothetical protein
MLDAFGGGPVEIGNDDKNPRSRHSAGHRAADAAAPTRDQCYLSQLRSPSESAE